MASDKNPYLTGDLVDVRAVDQLRCDGQGDQLTFAVVVLLLVPQLEVDKKYTNKT